MVEDKVYRTMKEIDEECFPRLRTEDDEYCVQIVDQGLRLEKIRKELGLI